MVLGTETSGNVQEKLPDKRIAALEIRMQCFIDVGPQEPPTSGRSNKLKEQSVHRHIYNRDDTPEGVWLNLLIDRRYRNVIASASNFIIFITKDLHPAWCYTTGVLGSIRSLLLHVAFRQLVAFRADRLPKTESNTYDWSGWMLKSRRL